MSLVPSSTETLLALGADVVACTRFCERPELHHVGGPKNPDVAAIVDLRPDLVVLDREENRREDFDALAAAGVDLFVSDVTDVDAALVLVADLARRLGLPVPELPVPERPRPDPAGGAELVSFVPIWRRPWMSINRDTYGASVLDRLRSRLVTADADDRYPVVELAAVAAAGPDVVLVPSEPYEFSADHLAELGRAVPDAVVVRIDGQDLFWWGIRTPAALARLGTVLDDVRAGRPSS